MIHINIGSNLNSNFGSKIDNITIEERESNTKLTSKFYFSSKYHHAKILNRLRRQAPVREAERILEEVASE